MAQTCFNSLNDKDLRSDWMSELEDIRNSLLNLRVQLSNELQKISGSDRFSFIASHRGMFSRLGATPSQVEKMRNRIWDLYGFDSRFNVAGLNNETVPRWQKQLLKLEFDDIMRPDFSFFNSKNIIKTDFFNFLRPIMAIATDVSLQRYLI